jgi:multiple antibiotic resistance protein
MIPDFAVTFFGALFAIMNPLVNLPLFLSLTAGYTPDEQRRAGLAVVFYSTIMCAAVALVGPQILAFFGITVDDFRVAGGLVLAGIAFSMLNGGGNAAHEGGSGEKVGQPRENIAFYPLTFPMVVGPGTITTLVVFLREATTPEDKMIYAGVVGSILLMLAVVLYFAAAIGQRLSATLRVIMSRLMGMILLAIAISMLVAGLRALMPGLAGAA